MIEDLSTTTFNIDGYTTLENFLADYRELGLNTLELNARVPEFVIHELYPLIEQGEIKISSLHNVCPKSEVNDRSIQLSSLDEIKRKTAVDLTIKTIETANWVGAKAIVIHIGNIDGLSHLMGGLSQLYRDNKKDSKEFHIMKNELIDKRQMAAKQYTEAYEKSLYELSEFIARKNYDIKLGLENRRYYDQLTLIDECDELFNKYPDFPIYLWYDFGHGEALHNLSLINKYELLERHGNRLLGLHIHDCKGMDDHLVPGTGDIDFTFIKEYLHPGVIKVLEYGVRSSIKDISEGIEFLQRSGAFD